MLTPRTNLARRVTAALDASPSRIPVLVGGCGSGRPTLLQQLRDRVGRTDAQYIDVERTATTPERFLRAITAVSPFPVADTSSASQPGARAAFDMALAGFGRAKTAGSEPAMFLLDEFLELRTFESFPGLRRVLHDFVDGIAASGNKFVLTSRYVARTLRLLRDRSARFEVIHMPPLTAEDTLDILGPTAADAGGDAAHEADYLARTVQALAEGRPAYVRAITDELTALREHGGPGGGDAVSALVRLMAPGGTPREAVRFLLRTAPAPRARLRRAQGDSRDPRRRRGAHAHRDLTTAPPHARVDEGLSVLARRCRSRDVAAEAIQLHGPAAPRLGAVALPPLGAERRRPGQRSPSLRAAAPAATDRTSGHAASRACVRHGRWTTVGDYRDRLDRIGELVSW